MSIEAMKQALEALESFREISDFTPAQAVHAITALRTAIALAAQPKCTCPSGATIECMSLANCRLNAPPAAAQRQPLTDEQIWQTLNTVNMSDTIGVARAIERKHGIGGEA